MIIRLNTNFLEDDYPIGTVKAWFGITAPRNWLICDGLEYSRYDYPDLWDFIVTKAGFSPYTSDLNTKRSFIYFLDTSTQKFLVPDFRECTIVGRSSVNNAVYSIENHDLYSLGQYKDDCIQDHSHKYTKAYDTDAGYGTGEERMRSVVLASTGYAAGGRSNINIDVTHGKQIGVNWILKAK